MLGTEERERLATDGYAVARGVIPRDLAGAVAAAIYEHVDARVGRPRTWYQNPVGNRGIALMYHHPAQWVLRQHPDLYRAFADAWQREDLWVSIDRASFRPPDRRRYRLRTWLHWDVDPFEQPHGLTIQGLIYLTDCDEDMGPLRVVPSVYRDLEGWRARHPDVTTWGSIAEQERLVESVPGQAGDLVMWHTTLMHGPSSNRSRQPRLVQFVSMTPPEVSVDALEDRIDWWRAHRAPFGPRGAPQTIAPEPFPTAPLTELGRKLVGLDKW